MKDFNIHEKINIRSHVKNGGIGDYNRAEIFKSGVIFEIIEDYEVTIQELAIEDYNATLSRAHAHKVRGKKKVELSNLKW